MAKKKYKLYFEISSIIILISLQKLFCSEIFFSAKFPESLKQEIDAYIAFAELGSMNEFLIKAAEYVLAKDKEWKRKQS